MSKVVKNSIYDAIERSNGLCVNSDVEILAHDVYESIDALIRLITEMRLNQRVYFATRTKTSLERAIKSEQALDNYLNSKEESLFQTTIF